MKIHILTYCLFIIGFCTSSIYAQSFHYLSNGAGPVSLANSTIANSSHYAALNNQAGIINDNNWSLTASTQYLYGFTELSSFSGSFIKTLENKTSAISVSVKYFGNSELNTQLFGVAYARQLMKQWKLALQFDVLGYHVEGFGSRYVPTFEIGSIVNASKKLSFGFHLFNPIPWQLNEYEDYPSILRFGVSYQLSDKINMTAEVQKELDEKLNIAAGIEYKMAAPFTIRMGIATLPRQFHAGVGFHFGGSSIDGAFSWQNQLGMSPGIAYSYQK